MGNPETPPRTLADLRARFPAWEIVHVPPFSSADTGGFCASRNVHPALEPLATWSGISAATISELDALLSHRESLADVATGCLLARDHATTALIAELENYFRPR